MRERTWPAFAPPPTELRRLVRKPPVQPRRARRQERTRRPRVASTSQVSVNVPPGGTAAHAWRAASRAAPHGPGRPARQSDHVRLTRNSARPSAALLARSPPCRPRDAAWPSNETCHQRQPCRRTHRRYEVRARRRASRCRGADGGHRTPGAIPRCVSSPSWRPMAGSPCGSRLLEGHLHGDNATVQHSPASPEFRSRRYRPATVLPSLPGDRLPSLRAYGASALLAP